MRRGRRRLSAVAAFAALLGGACADGEVGDRPVRAGCSPARPHQPGTTTVEVRSGGDDRRAVLFVPASYDGTEAFPVVLSWHGYSSSAEAHLEYADFRRVAESEGFLVVLPQGQGQPARFNLEAGIVGETDDVAFAVALVDHVEDELCVDTDRVYSAGSSNGAGMSALLACREPGRLAAIAMVSMSLIYEPCGSPAPAVLGMMGDADLVVPIQGGRVNCCDGWPIAPAATTMARWARHAGCRGERADEQVEDHVELTTWSGCGGDGRAEVRYYVIRDGGHTWPGAAGRSQLGPTNREIDAAEVIWEFFARYPVERR